MDIVPLQLQLAGKLEKFKSPFWQLSLRHYAQINADSILVQPTGITPNSINFGNQVYLLDYTVAPNGDLLLFWQVNPNHAEPMPDLHITGTTFTADGLPFMRLPDRRRPVMNFRPFAGRAAKSSWGAFRRPIGSARELCLGLYPLRLGVYDVNGDLTGIDVIGPKGQPLGKSVTLTIPLRRPVKGPDVVDKVTYAQIIPDLFTEVSLSTEQAEPGQLFGAEIHWYAEEKMKGDYDLLARWRLRSDNSLQGEQTIPLTPEWPTSKWPDDELMHTLHQLRPPLRLAPGDYWVEVGLTAPGSGFVRLPFHILSSTRMFAPPPYATKVNISFGQGLRLLGIIEPLQTRPQPGQQVVLTLVWQAQSPMDADYSATVQLLGPDSKPMAQADQSLPGGSANWLPHQVELQTLVFTAPSKPGTYRLVTAVYNANAPDLPRLLTIDGRDMVQLGEVTVAP